ncbi:MAG: hypothetical protein EXX96DRAFT_538254 [Benjaminiella poitrasii]|nr:MAG: hypothetical protein EXX96DRAFT_544057 [Benjaminiella poitrasii]KAI9481022.1 MAG: hypothetical protein EXX96DRAFT_538254 [Benjaminiella poitrasii]
MFSEATTIQLNEDFSVNDNENSGTNRMQKAHSLLTREQNKLFEAKDNKKHMQSYNDNDEYDTKKHTSFGLIQSCSEDKPSFDETTEDYDMKHNSKNPQMQDPQFPAMELFIRNIGLLQTRIARMENQEEMNKKKSILNNKVVNEQEYAFSLETSVDMSIYCSRLINSYCLKDVTVNQLGPREQEEADELFRKGMKCLFDNKFLEAKALFQQKSSCDPLYALGLGIMAFIKAIMTFNDDDIGLATNTLKMAYNISKAQIDRATTKKANNHSLWLAYLSNFVSTNQSGLPKDVTSTANSNRTYSSKNKPIFISNGILRATVVKAECCLLMAMLQIMQENSIGYLKCGINLRKAFNNYAIVWKEYKRMGQEYTKYMDRDTVSAIQFGIGSIHLLLSTLPHKFLKSVSNFGFKSNKQLGFALLKLCIEAEGVRSSLASLMLLAYYSLLCSLAPQLYSKEFILPAVECLKNTQKEHPTSCLFFLFAARISRAVGNLSLSTQSFTFAIEYSRHEWAEHAISQLIYFEIGFNLAMQLKWQSAISYFEKLSKVVSNNGSDCWSFAFCQYFIGACKGMLGSNTDSILAFAEASRLLESSGQYQTQNKSFYVDQYVQQKVEFYQKKGYQDMDLCLPGLELLLVWNAYEQMDTSSLEECLNIVQKTLELIYERERADYKIRLHELIPSVKPPDYYIQRASLLLIKASILNSLKRYDNSISSLNWIIDHKQKLKSETWIIPFAYWEAGITSWGLNDYAKSRRIWEQALSCTKYALKYRLNVRLSLALNKCDEKDVTIVKEKKQKGLSTNGRKRMPIVRC